MLLVYARFKLPSWEKTKTKKNNWLTIHYPWHFKDHYLRWKGKEKEIIWIPNVYISLFNMKCSNNSHVDRLSFLKVSCLLPCRSNLFIGFYMLYLLLYKDRSCFKWKTRKTEFHNLQTSLAYSFSDVLLLVSNCNK